MKPLAVLVLLFLVSGMHLTAQPKQIQYSENDIVLMRDALRPELNPALASVMATISPSYGAYYNDMITMGSLFMLTDIGGALLLGSRSYEDYAMILLFVPRVFMLFYAPAQASANNEARAEAIIRLRQRGISLSDAKFFPQYSPTRGLGLAVSVPIH